MAREEGVLGRLDEALHAKLTELAELQSQLPENVYSQKKEDINEMTH